MLRDFVSVSRYAHEEYTRRRVRSPEPLEQSRHGLRRVIGQSLIAMGERLVMTGNARRSTRRPEHSLN